MQQHLATSSPMCVTSANAQIAKLKNGLATLGDCPDDTCEGDDEVDCTLDEEGDWGETDRTCA